MALGHLQIEARTRSDIEDKKRQLRQLVGGSYRQAMHSDCCAAQLLVIDRADLHGCALLMQWSGCRDLISSADTILSMVQSCQSVVDHVSTVQASGAEPVLACCAAETHGEACTSAQRTSQLRQSGVGGAKADCDHVPMGRQARPSSEHVLQCRHHHQWHVCWLLCMTFGSALPSAPSAQGKFCITVSLLALTHLCADASAAG